MPQSSPIESEYDVVVVGGGPAGATCAEDLASTGARVLLLDREGRIKPCGGAIPTRAIEDFDIPPHMMTAEIKSARMVGPSQGHVDMPIREGFVGMVDRDSFDPFLRRRAGDAGATVLSASFTGALTRDDQGLDIAFLRKGSTTPETVRARLIVGADGANSAVRRTLFQAEKRPPYVFAYHEIVRSPARCDEAFDPARCDVHYAQSISPDFYGWVFPHGETTSVGVGSAIKGFDFKGATRALRAASGLSEAETIREEGAPIPLKPLKRWDNGRNAVLVGDAAGTVAPASGEGIYYAMLCGRLAAEAATEFLATGRAKALLKVRKRFMREHGSVFFVLGFMQAYWYRDDRRRERFVALCEDRDIQRLVWVSYLTKRLVRSDPMSYIRVFLKDMRHVVRLALPERIGGSGRLRAVLPAPAAGESPRLGGPA